MTPGSFNRPLLISFGGFRAFFFPFIINASAEDLKAETAQFKAVLTAKRFNHISKPAVGDFNDLVAFRADNVQMIGHTQ